MTNAHAQRVRILFKTIMKLHRGLPAELSELGSQYTRDEFKRHKKCTPLEANVFISEWTNYALSLAEQLGLRGPKTGSRLGAPLSNEDLEKFKDEQIFQLYELMEASRITKKSTNTEKS